MTTMLGALLLALATPAGASAWTWPADGPVLRSFEFGGAEYHERGHSGVDVGAPTGALVAAPASGTVSFAGWLPGNGRTATIRTSDGYAVTLTHLGALAVTEGDGVAEGERVGSVGPSGDVELDVPYVHLGIRRADDPKGYVDPLTLLPPRPAPSPPPEPAAPAAGAPAPMPRPATAAPASVADDRQPAPAAPAAVEAPAEPAGNVVAARSSATGAPRRQASAVRPVRAKRRVRARATAPTATRRPAAPTARKHHARRTVSTRPLVSEPAVPYEPAPAAPQQPPQVRRRPPAPARPPWALAGAALLALAGAGLLAGQKVTQGEAPIMARG